MRADNRTLAAILLSVAVSGTFGLFPLKQSRASESNDGPASQQVISNRMSAPEALQLATQNAQTSGADSVVDPLQDAIAAQLAAKGVRYRTLDENQRKETYVEVIVQLKASPAANNGSLPENGASTAEIQAATERVIASQSSLKKAAEKITHQAATSRYGYVINGFTTKVKVKDIAKLQQLAGVKSVTVAKVYYAAESSANDMANVSSVWSNYKYKGEGTVVSIIDTGIDPNHKDLRLSNNSSAKLTRRDVNAFTQSSGYGKYFTAKVPYGHNYSDNNEIIVDDDPAEQHGMHVAGIVGANGTGKNPTTSVVGVAPEAQLLAMKAFSNSDTSSTTDSTTVIAAIDDSAKLGADVLNMSLGSSAGRQTLDDPEIAAVENAVANGTASVISAGNSGTSAGGKGSTNKDYLGEPDNSMVGSPGTARGATTVASAENTKAINTAITITDGATTIIGPSTTQISEGISTAIFNNRQYVALKNADGKLSFGLPEDYASQDVSGKIVVVSRGSIAFTAKQANAKAAGAAGILIVNNAGGDIALTSVAYTPGFPTAGLSTNDGQKLVAYLDANPNKILSVTIGLVQLDNQVQKVDRMSEFTSYGPVSDLSFKPDITAPGGNIWSLQNKNGYTNLSGTSMASPFIAGSQALLKQAISNPKNAFYTYYQTLNGSEISALFKTIEMNTADIIPDVSHAGVPVSPRRQGAGMVNLEAAIQAIETNPSTVTGENGYPGIELKSTNRRTHAFKLKFTNRTANDLTYTLDQPEKLTGIYTSAIDPVTAVVYDTAINGASIHPNETIDVPAGQTREIAFTLNLPNDFKENQYVEGFLAFTASDNSKLRIPYMGYFGNWGEPEIFDKLNGKAFDPNNNNYGTIVAGLNSKGSIITIPGFGTDANGAYFVEENKIAFSTASTASVRAIQPQYYLFRNAVNVSTQILDSQGNIITQLSNDYSLTKTYWNANAQQYTRYTSAPSWDGSYVDQATGKTVKVKDGSYRYRITGTVDGTSQTQNYDFSVKVDSVKPSVRNLKLTRNRDQAGNTTYFLTAEAKDDFSGIGDTANFSVNGVTQSDAEYQQVGTTADGYSQLKFALSDDQAKALQAGRNALSIAVFDNASNAATTSASAQKPGETNFGLVLNGSGIPDVITTKTSAYTAPRTGGKFAFTGSYPLEPVFTYTKEDGTEVNGRLSYTAATQTFTAELPVETADYTTTIRFYTDDSRDTLIYEKQVRIATVPPMIQTISVDDNLTFDATTASATSAAATSENSVTLTGKVSADTKSLVITNSANADTKVSATIDADGNYTAVVPVQGGSNTLTLTATDADGNTQALTQTVNSSNYGDVVQSNKDVTFNDGARFGFVYVNARTKNYNPATGEISISGRVARPTTTLTIDGKPITIEADQTFKTTLQIGLQGSKPFSVLIGDISTNELVQERITFYVDGQTPTLTLDAAKDADGDSKTDVVYTDKPVFNLSGRVTDNLPYYTLSINGNALRENLPEIDMNSTASLDEKFSYPQQLKVGENHFSLTVTDYLSNSTTKDITVIYTPRDQAAIDAAKASLQAKFAQSTELSQSDRYTPESQQNLEAARTQAAIVLNDEDASVSDYQAAERALDQAIGALVKKETTEKPSTDSKENVLNQIVSVRAALDPKVGESKNSEEGLSVYSAIDQITADLNAGTITPEEALTRLNQILDSTLKSQAQSIKNGTTEEIGQKINQVSGHSYFTDIDSAVTTGLAASDFAGKLVQINELQTLRALIQKENEDGQKPVDPNEGSKPVDPDEGSKPVNPGEGSKPAKPIDGNKNASKFSKNDGHNSVLPKSKVNAKEKTTVVVEPAKKGSFNDGQVNNSNQNLPQTGEFDGNALTLVGLTVVGLMGLVAASRRKRTR